jgi:predicted DNA-binding antitoxin AbrB/MazE fold protein
MGMTREFEAIYEDGVLKPVEPLGLAEKQRVMLRLSDVAKPAPHPGSRAEEMRWIGENAHLYKGEYVALQGSELVSHGRDGHAVLAEARGKGVKQPLIYHVPEHLGEPSIEWF